MNLFTRRYILKVFSSIVLFTGSGFLFQILFSTRTTATDENQTLSAFLNTLIPPDETPGATTLGVDRKILAKAEKEANYKKLIKDGCKWLNNRAVERGSYNFASLNELQRDYLVTLASSGKINSLERVFFIKIRNDAFYYYYSHPTTWNALRYPGPPQPMGFMNYTSPPRQHRI